MTNEKESSDSAPISSSLPENPTTTNPKTSYLALLLIVILLAVGWFLVLGGMVITTANPVTFNQRQILESERLVVATISKIGEDGTLDLQVTEELLPQSQQTKTIQVLYNKLSLTEGASYIFPLSRRLDLGYTITRTELSGKRPLVYAANEKSIKRLKQKLKEWRQLKRQPNNKNVTPY